MATYYKVNTETGFIDPSYRSRLDKRTASILNYAYALNGATIRLTTLKGKRFKA